MSRDSGEPGDPGEAPSNVLVVDVIAVEVPLDDPRVQAEVHRLADEANDDGRREHRDDRHLNGREHSDHRDDRQNNTGQRDDGQGHARNTQQRDHQQRNSQQRDNQPRNGRDDRQRNETRDNRPSNQRRNGNGNGNGNNRQANARGNNRKTDDRGNNDRNRSNNQRDNRSDRNDRNDRNGRNRGKQARGNDQNQPRKNDRGRNDSNKRGGGDRNGGDRNHKSGGGHGPSHRAKLLLVIIGIAAAVLAVLFAVVLHLKRSHADKNERDKREDALAQGPQIPIATVIAAPKTRKVTLPGDVKAVKLAVVYARVSGYLAELSVDRGDKVVKDQVLGRVTTPDTEQQLAPLIASLNTKSVIANRLRPLVTKGVVAQQDLDRADADVQEAKSEVDRLKAVKSFDLIRAPFDGVVTKRYVDVGALMPAPTGSTQSAQPLVDVADTSKVRVVVYAGQRDATGIRLGDHLTITRDDDPTHPIDGSVTRIPMDLDLKTRTMWVECELPNPDGRLYPGLFVTVSLDVPAPEGVLIPSDAVAIVNGKPTVARIDDDHVKFVPVELADDDGKVARVVKGLKAGDTIAQRVSDELSDGGKVRGITPEELRKKRQADQAKDTKGGKGSGDAKLEQPAGSAGSAQAFPGTEGSGGTPHQGSATPNFTGSAAPGAGYGAAGSADTQRSTP